jgi:hypothetical protein
VKRTGLNWSIEELAAVAPKLAEDLVGHAVKPAPQRRGRSHYSAKPQDVVWSDGTIVRCASKAEARVAQRLLLEARATKARLYRNVHVPLLSIAPEPGGVAFSLTVDFVLRYADGRTRYIDAKSGKRSRDWNRGRAAAEAELGTRIEEVDR